jgi:1-acyl-sn-glycerol-3-phosphate acyltransferase
MIHFILRSLSVLIFKLLFRIQAVGRENIPRKGGFIIASNHLSYLDPVAVGISCPRALNYMARHDLFTNRWFSWLLYGAHAFPVKRNSADLTALKEAIHRVRQGKGLLVFPEGTRQDKGASPVQPQAGVGFLAEKLGVPVVPAFVKGTEKAFPKGAKGVTPGKVIVYFGKQIHIERGMPYQEVADLIMAGIRGLS